LRARQEQTDESLLDFGNAIDGILTHLSRPTRAMDQVVVINGGAELPETSPPGGQESKQRADERFE
jgi:hypothetical protein